jgi:hypothetical protein
VDVVLSIYGAVLATYVLWRQIRRERRVLSLTIELDFPDAEEYDHGPGYFRVRAVNTGLTAISLESLGVEFSIDLRSAPARQILDWYGGPTVKQGQFLLGQYESIEGHILQEELRRLVLDNQTPIRVTYVQAIDTTGKVHQQVVPRWAFELGHESWEDRRVRPIRGGVSAAWLRWWLWVSDRGRLGQWVVKLLHRVHLFPIGVPGGHTYS